MEKTSIFLQEFLAFFPEIVLEHPHEHRDFFLVTFPVLGREAPHGQDTDTWIIPAPVGKCTEVFDGDLMPFPDSF